MREAQILIGKAALRSNLVAPFCSFTLGEARAAQLLCILKMGAVGFADTPAYSLIFLKSDSTILAHHTA